MISRILALSIQNRWLIVLAGFGVIVVGAWSLTRLPIDAVPDITNKQVQVNTTAPALSPAEIEKQVTFRIETALAGIPGLDIHALALAQRLFPGDRGLHAKRPTSISRASRSTNACSSCGLSCPPASSRKWDRSRPVSARSTCGPSTFAPEAPKAGQPGWQPTAAISRPRPALTIDVERPLSAHGAGLDRPAADQERAGRCRRRFDRRLRQAIPGAARSDEAGGSRPVVRRCHQGDRGQQCQPRRQL